MTMAAATCSACGGGDLRLHLRVAGESGEEGLIPTTTKFGTALADISRCQECGHMQLERMPSVAELAQAYANAASADYIEEEAGQRETARRALARIEAHAPRRGSLLDLGCWVGFLLSEAAARGWRTLGVEPSEFGSDYARSQLGLRVLRDDLLEAPLPSHSFDAVTMADVIEHLVDPEAALRRVLDVLRPDGVLWLALPDAGSAVARLLGRRWWSVIPTHVQYFTRGSIATLLHRQGFELLDLTTAPKAFTVAYYLNRIEGYSPAAGRGIGRFARAAGVAERVWAPDFRDRMSVLARPAVSRN
jgi:SAM-dependent methyltransferase